MFGGSTPEYRGDTPTRASQDPRIEYVFSGWEPPLRPVYEDTVYEAQFTERRLNQVSFDPNDGSGTMAPQYYYVDMGTFRLPACAFTAPSGCAFQNWILETGGAGSGDPVTVRYYNAGELMTGLSGDVTVKANWVESNVVVGAYPPEGGTAVYDSTSGTFTAYPAAGYRFHHWEYVENEHAMTPENPDWPTDNPYAPTPVLNGIYTACFKRPNFRTHALLLSGQIGVYFYMDLSMLSDDEKQASYMEFTVSGKTSTDAFDAACTNLNGDGYYGFTCFINSIQMADTITAVFHYGDGETVSETYSAKEYVDYVLEHTNRYSANTVALVKAIADYGHYVQPFLADANGWAVGTDHAAMDNANTYGDTDVAAARSAVESCAIQRDVGDTGIEAVTYSLNLETETSIRIYLKVKEGYTGTVAASLSGSDLTCVRLSDGRYRVEIGGISAHKLADVYEVAVTAGGSFTIQVSALSYVNTVLNSDSALFNNDTARYAVTSLYRYYLATRTYQQNPND